ncbi:DUF6409 family protein [Streptomyces spectabilis]|uniref:DUF6409 family protein n=1 Tax=Streptomyces spectabilis TaxID=68270 RepID=UPI0033E4727D
MNATTTVKPGTVIRAPHMVAGHLTGVRRGVVLGEFAKGDPTSGYLVWFYGAGPAQKATSLVFPRELKAVGTIDDMSERTLTTIARGLNGSTAGRTLWMEAGSKLAQKRAARRGC